MQISVVLEPHANALAGRLAPGRKIALLCFKHAGDLSFGRTMLPKHPSRLPFCDLKN